MLIETQETPDKNVLNFFPGKTLLKKGNAEFADAKTIRKSPLAEQIFDLGGIKSVFITPDMISVTKEEQSSWEDLKPLVLAEIMDYLATGREAVINEEKNSVEETIQKIHGLLDARIRPAVRQDGGDIVFKKYENGTLFVEMQGTCAGCPYAMRTLKEGVEKIIKTYIPEVKSVEKYEN